MKEHPLAIEVRGRRLLFKLAHGCPFRPCPFLHFPSFLPRVTLPLVLKLSFQGASAMEWVTPHHEEVDLNCEVSSYANAEL
jgi:hypothetical protein